MLAYEDEVGELSLMKERLETGFHSLNETHQLQLISDLVDEFKGLQKPGGTPKSKTGISVSKYYCCSPNCKLIMHS